MDYFFYGTLMDADVRAAVLGRTLAPMHLGSAVLRGFRRVRMAGTAYPVLAAGGPEDRVDGLLARGLSRADTAKLIRYEGAAYVVKSLPVETAPGETVMARIFCSRSNVRLTAEPWTLVDWLRQNGGGRSHAR